MNGEFRAKKPFLTLNLGANGLKVTSEPPPMAGQAGCLQGRDRSAVTHPSSGHARRKCPGHVGRERQEGEHTSTGRSPNASGGGHHSGSNRSSCVNFRSLSGASHRDTPPPPPPIVRWNQSRSPAAAGESGRRSLRQFKSLDFPLYLLPRKLVSLSSSLIMAWIGISSAGVSESNKISSDDGSESVEISSADDSESVKISSDDNIKSVNIISDDDSKSVKIGSDDDSESVKISSDDSSESVMVTVQSMIAGTFVLLELTVVI
ncbi:hypothetical protein J6590_036050 [Homalodisca vitripennis]|nr:hypothetical protein J6590_036050 [Homalodisca vitripennis]